MKIRSISDSFKEFASKKLDTNFGRKIGTLLFTKESVERGINQLDKILRLLLWRNKITLEYFNDKFKEYALNVEGIHPTRLRSKKGNLLKALKNGRITFRTFMETLTGAFGFKLVDVTFKFERNGEVQEISLSETNLTKEEKHDD